MAAGLVTWSRVLVGTCLFTRTSPACRGGRRGTAGRGRCRSRRCQVKGEALHCTSRAHQRRLCAASAGGRAQGSSRVCRASAGRGADAVEAQAGALLAPHCSLPAQRHPWHCCRHAPGPHDAHPARLTLRQHLARRRDAVPVQQAELPGDLGTRRARASWQDDAVLRAVGIPGSLSRRRAGACGSWCRRAGGGGGGGGGRAGSGRCRPAKATPPPRWRAHFLSVALCLRSTMQRPNPRSRLARFITIASSMSYLFRLLRRGVGWG